MGNSDSDTENECFESAEESLDENDELESKKVKARKTLCKGESEDAKPVFFNRDTTNSLDQVEENISSNLSYRKRPERVKRSEPPSKPVSKLPPNELKFNTDKIVSDIFFQDITSNLSKNINKSLNTLQQTSSNVKDLILSSLPVSSACESENFAYDGKNVFSSAIPENKSSNTGSNSQSKTVSETIRSAVKSISEVKEENFDEKSTFTQREGNSSMPDRININDTVKKSPDIEIENIKKQNCKFNDCILDNIGEKEINSFKEQDNITYSNSLLANSAVGDYHELKVKTVPEKRKDHLQNSFKTSSNYINLEKISNQEEANKEEFNKTDLIIISSETNQQNKESDSTEDICIKYKKPSEMLNEGLDSSQEKHLIPAVGDKLNLDKSNKIHLEVIKDNENLAKSNRQNDFIDLTNDKKELDSECNFEQLKLALKNIVQEEKSSSQSINLDLENKFLKNDFSLEEKVNFHKSSKDGWDDFDFSDSEVENVYHIENKFSEKKNTNTNTELKNKEAKVAESKSVCCNANMKPKESEDSALTHQNLKKNLISSKNLKTTELKITDLNITKRDLRGQKNNKKKIEKLEQYSGLKEVSDDSWDWDSWNENPEDEEKVESKANEKPIGQKNVEDDFFDVSKWSGWDTFGQKPQEQQGNWSLGSWGVDVLLNKATVVTQGISNVLEASLGAPDPETFARLEKQERERLKEFKNEEKPFKNEEPLDESSKKNSLTNIGLFPVSGITNLVAGVTSKIVEHSKIQEIGSKVITGGLDTLETLGKKTMEVLQEGDPGLKNKSSLLLCNTKPVLSQVLKEAREKAEKEMKKAEEKEFVKKCHFETLFDDFQGMVHLEALEMLSRQCELKLDQIKRGMNSEELEDLNGILEEVKQLCSLDEYDTDMKPCVTDFKTALQMAVEPLKIEISVQRIIQIHEDATEWLKMASESDVSIAIIFQKLVSILAELAAATVHQFHKSGELLSVKECRKTVEEVDALSRLTNVLCKEINRLCEKFVLLHHATSHKEILSENIDSFNEKAAVVMQNSTTYIRQAFDLLIPVIQLGAAV